MKKILSIIIPTYNMEKYLRKCLDSLIVSDENMQLLEVLVINDGSKDSSSQIAHEYETKFSQTFRVIDKENGNYGSCVNRGLKEATGKYVKVLDADDYFVREVFDEYVNRLNNMREDVDLVLTDYSQIDEYGKTTLTSKFTHYLPVGSVFTLNKLAESPEMMRSLIHQNITYKTKNLVQMNYRQTEGISYTDNEWVFMPSIAVNKICYFPCNFYVYLIGREGQTFDPKVFFKSYGQRGIVMLSMVDYYSKNYDTCSSSSKVFMKARLIARLGDFYYYHLCINGSKGSCETLLSFETNLKLKCPDVFEELNNVSNKMKIHYIRSWRKSNYNEHLLILRILRAKDFLKSLTR